MRLVFIGALLLTLLPMQALANAGDLDLSANVFIKHVKRTEWYSQEMGYVSYVESPDHIGLRYGLDEYRNIGASFGTNSLGNKSLLLMGELHYPLHRYVKAGIMVGLANGYEPWSSNGLRFIGGPSLRVLTPYLGVTATLYGTEALTLNVDFPLRTHLRH